MKIEATLFRCAVCGAEFIATDTEDRCCSTECEQDFVLSDESYMEEF